MKQEIRKEVGIVDRLRKTYISERWIFYAFLILVIVTQAFFIKKLLIEIEPIYDKEKNIALKYNNNNTLNYNVVLKDNVFTNDEMKDSDAYVFDFVDHIHIDHKYLYTADRDSDINGKYTVTATMKIYYRESSNINANPKIWQTSDTLQSSSFAYNDNQFALEKQVDISLESYRQKLVEFQKTVNVAVDGYLEISFNTIFNGRRAGKLFTEDNNNYLKISLNGSVFKVEKNYQENEDKKVYFDVKNLETTNIIFLVILNIICFIILSILIKIIFFTKYTSKYKKELYNIYKDYDDIIVSTKNMIDITKYDIIEITEFKELLNLSRESAQPIIGYELDDKTATWFYIIKDDILYRYIVHNKEKMIHYQYDDKKKKH
ncbi:MAG: DUF5305 family protein [Bacilli bacterium]